MEADPVGRADRDSLGAALSWGKEFGLQARHLRIDGVRLLVWEAGPPDGFPVILLHGFPEFSFSWRLQVPALAASGLRVIVPDQRGYAGSERPSRVRDYALPRLGADVAGLIEASGGRASLVGHDWGAAVAWWTAARYPDRVDRLVILNVPHPTVMLRTLLTSFRQLGRSWYILFFQIPWLPEWLLGRNRGSALARTLVRTSLPGTFSRQDLDRYREIWRGASAVRPMLNWYRAALRGAVRLDRTPEVTVPTCILWGERDGFLGVEMVEPSARMCRGQVRVRRFPELTHWLHLEAPDEINREVTAWLSQGERL